MDPVSSSWKRIPRPGANLKEEERNRQTRPDSDAPPNVFPSRCQVGGRLAGQHQARFARDATAGDIEGSAVVNRDADHSEADGNVER